MRIALGSDHAGFDFAERLSQHLTDAGYDVTRVGASSLDPFDYPDASDLVAAELLAGKAMFGALICGTGIGVAIRANRHLHVRAAQCWTKEMAELARRHNHANVICFGERIQNYADCVEILDTFLSTQEDTAERHALRVAKLDATVKTS